MNEENNKWSNANEVPQAEIVITKHSKLYDLFAKPHLFWRIQLFLFLVFVVFMIGITVLVLVLKSQYPYNLIETTKYGATIMKNDDKEVIYWLLNSADAWANTGISVKKGEELTIRASGLSHAGIHHLVQDASKNEKPQMRWENADGQYEHSPNDPLLGKFRLEQNQPEGMLLMRIFSEEKSNDRPNWINDPRNEDVLNENKYTFAIGQERRNLIVPTNGFLHFSVNDILLTNKVILDIYDKYFDFLWERYGIDDKKNNQEKKEIEKKKVKEIVKEIACKKNNIDKDRNNREKLEEINENCFSKEKWVSALKMSDKNRKDLLWFAPYKSGVDSTGFPLVTELIYYKELGFRNVWFVDNLGSFLIVIERRKH